MVSGVNWLLLNGLSEREVIIAPGNGNGNRSLAECSRDRTDENTRNAIPDRLRIHGLKMASAPLEGGFSDRKRHIAYSSGPRCEVASSSTQPSSSQVMPRRPGTLRVAPAR